MWDEFWKWLIALPPGGASFLGTVAGSSLGLIAILLGALFNAHLNRRRDRALRRREQAALATALRAELQDIHRALVRNTERLGTHPPPADGGFLVPAPEIHIFPQVLAQLGLLPFQVLPSVLTAYLTAQEYVRGLVLIGGTLRTGMPEGVTMVYLPSDRAELVAAYNEARIPDVAEGMNALLPYVE